MFLFTGFRLELSKEYDPLIAELHRRTHYDTITWVKPDLFHITLTYIFGSHYAPKVLWLGISNTPELQQLYNTIDDSLQQLNFSLPKENFVPHITLGRIKKFDNKNRFWQMFEELQPSYHQKFHISHISLIRSQLEKEGPIYTTLYDFPLLGKNMPENGISTPSSAPSI